MAEATLRPSPGSDQELLAAGDDARGSSVLVRTTARLHLGFLDLNGGLGRRFGSMGMALDGPETRLVLRPSAHSIVTGCEQARAQRYLTFLETALDLPHRHGLHVADAIPAHSGLGSGTQLALAVATALRRLHGLKPDLRGDAAMLGRGARSGIGIALFRRGGFVLDGGRGEGNAPPPLLAHLRVPAAWRVLLLRDPSGQGLSGEAEKGAFAALPPMPEQEADRLCRLAVMQLLPALAEADLPRFGAAVTEIQHRVGAHFAPAQGGGRCASARVGSALERLGAAGATGLGQTSWGPTGFAFAASAEAAKRLLGMLRRHDDLDALEISVHRPLNRGARVGWAR